MIHPPSRVHIGQSRMGVIIPQCFYAVHVISCVGWWWWWYMFRSAAFKDFVSRCLNKNPEERPDAYQLIEVTHAHCLFSLPMCAAAPTNVLDAFDHGMDNHHHH